MLTATTPCCPGPSGFSGGPALLRELSIERTQRLDLSFTDEQGQEYRLTLERDISLHALTYDRRGALAGRGRLRRPADWERLLAESDRAVEGFRKILHRFVKALRKGEASHLGDVAPGVLPKGGRGAASYVEVEQSVRITLEGPEGALAGDWSVEATAGRLRDFGVGLYRGGDRGEHAAKMIQAMERGYEEARIAFGGELPDVARQTVDLARRLLEEWAKGETAEPDPADALDLVA
ncbi:hypothetical protein [Deferrisoma palaeochoriense]